MQWPMGRCTNQPVSKTENQAIKHKPQTNFQLYSLLGYNAWVDGHKICFTANILPDASHGGGKVTPGILQEQMKSYYKESIIKTSQSLSGNNIHHL